MRELTAEIIENSQTARDIFLLRVRMPEDFNQEVEPGQFAHIKVPGDKLLRRPISINDYYASERIMSFAYQIKGEGTLALSRAQAQSDINLLVPLGNGFPEAKGRILLAGAGIGCAPLLYAAKSYKGDCGAALAFRSAEYAYELEEFDSYVSKLYIATDDGSLGDKCYAHELVGKALDEGGYDAVYACGPERALALIRDVCAQKGVNCYLSLEARMGCGMGACMVCNVKIGSREEWHYKRCCKDGPVFDGREVLFDD